MCRLYGSGCVGRHSLPLTRFPRKVSASKAEWAIRTRYGVEADSLPNQSEVRSIACAWHFGKRDADLGVLPAMDLAAIRNKRTIIAPTQALILLWYRQSGAEPQAIRETCLCRVYTGLYEGVASMILALIGFSIRNSQNYSWSIRCSCSWLIKYSLATVTASRTVKLRLVQVSWTRAAALKP
jgi:hypothetical protein